MTRTSTKVGRPTLGYPGVVRIHISLDDALVAELDRRVGARGRSRFIAEIVRQALEGEQRWDDVESAIGQIADHGHLWDDDPGAWVRAQRGADPAGLGRA